MKKKLQSQFSNRQYMLSKNFELYYYHDTSSIKVSKHTHNYYEFYVFLEGDVSIEIEDTLYPLQFGDIMLIPPGVSHRAVIHSFHSPYRRFIFWISKEYCNHLLSLSPDYAFLMQYVITNHEYIFHLDRISFNHIQSKMLSLIEEMQTRRFGQESFIILKVNDLVLRMNRIIYEQKNPQQTSEELSLYQNIYTYIEEHLEENLTLEKIAEEFFVSKFYIAHLFKNNLGISLHQFITKKRLALCREAILSNMNITKAYQTYGFGDYSSFYRAFKKEYGISPKDLRDTRPI